MSVNAEKTVDRRALENTTLTTNKEGPWWKDAGLCKLNFMLFFLMFSEFTQGYDASLINNVQQLKAWQNGMHAGRILLGLGGVVVAAIGPVWMGGLAYPDHRATATAMSNTTYSAGAILSAWVTLRNGQ